MNKMKSQICVVTGVLLLTRAAFAAIDSKTVIALIDSRNYSLTVVSAHGTPVPGIGTNSYAWQSTLVCSVDAIETKGTTNWTCTGWTGTGDVPAFGTTNTTGIIILTNLSSSITWNWRAYYALTVNNGSGDGSFTNGTQVAIVADAPAIGKTFDQWIGDTQYVENFISPTTTVTMPAMNITLTAVFTNLYTVNSNNTVTLTGTSGTNGTVFIPETLEGFPVTAIANLAFYRNTNCMYITVPATVTNIGVRAFSECPQLKGVYFLGNPPALGANAFKDSPQVTVYYYPGSTNWTATFGGRPAVLLPYLYTMQNGEVTITKYTGNEAEVAIPSVINGLPVTGVGDWSFYGLENLTGVTIPSGVTWIGAWAFGDCINLSGVIIPGSVTNIGNEAFSGCTSLLGVHFMGSAPGLGSNVFLGDNQATVFYLPRTANWGATFGGRPAVLWMTPTIMIIR